MICSFQNEDERLFHANIEFNNYQTNYINNAVIFINIAENQRAAGIVKLYKSYQGAVMMATCDIGNREPSATGTLVNTYCCKKTSTPVSTVPVSLKTAFEIRRKSALNSNCELFIKKFIEDAYLIRETKSGNRFRSFFAHIFEQVATISRNETSLINEQYREELANMELLLYEAIHCVDESFELYFDIARNADFFILYLLPKQESAVFFEAMANTAQHHSKRQHGIMLGCLGAVLEYNNIRISEACEQYKKALDVLEPLGDSMELAWLYNHIGFTWSEKGNCKKAER